MDLYFFRLFLGLDSFFYFFDRCCVSVGAYALQFYKRIRNCNNKKMKIYQYSFHSFQNVYFSEIVTISEALIWKNNADYGNKDGLWAHKITKSFICPTLWNTEFFVTALV